MNKNVFLNKLRNIGKKEKPNMEAFRQMMSRRPIQDPNTGFTQLPPRLPTPPPQIEYPFYGKAPPILPRTGIDPQERKRLFNFSIRNQPLINESGTVMYPEHMLPKYRRPPILYTLPRSLKKLFPVTKGA